MKLLYGLPVLAYLNKTYAGDVLKLGESDFASTVENSDLSLVKFYAPWCGHCKKIAPEFEKAATILKANDPPVTLIEVDCTEHQSVCSKYGVSGYPTMKVFRNGDASDYNGGRQAGDMVKVMGGQAGPSSVEIRDESKLTSLLNAKTNVVFGFFAADSDDAKNFNKIANEFRDSLKFAHSSNADIAEKAGYAIGDIVLMRPKAMKSKFEEQEIKFEGKNTVGLIRSFVVDNKNGLAPVITLEDLGAHPKPVTIAIFNVDYTRDPKGTQYWRNRVMKVAKEFPDNHYAVADAAEFERLTADLGVDFDGKSPMILQLHEDQSKYIMTETFDPKGVAFGQFLSDLKEGKIEKHVKSEGPQDNEGKPNKVLTARNFDDYVDGSKDAFIEFYAPWCGHCKSLAPKWEEMAGKMEKSGANLVVGKFDATANDVPPQFEVKGFPTLFWVPKGSVNSPVKYEGGRETKDLIAYAQKHGSGKDEL